MEFCWKKLHRKSIEKRKRKERFLKIKNTLFSLANRTMASLPVERLIELVANYILLGSKQSDKMLRGLLSALNSVLNQYDPNKAQVPTAIIDVFGSLLTNLEFAIKQDQSLGNEFLKVMKQEPSLWSVISFSLMLLLSKLQRFEEKTVSYMKSFVLNNCKRQFSTTKVAWLKGIISNWSKCVD